MLYDAGLDDVFESNSKMSGLEVIGVVLGAWPIAIQALAMYKRTKSGRTAEQLIRRLKTEELIFKNSVLHLLDSEVADDEIEKLLKPDMVTWRDSKVTESLTHKLGKDMAENVIDIVQEMAKLLASLDTEMKNVSQGIVSAERQIPAKHP